MQERKITTLVQVCQPEELSPTDRQLVEKAKEATRSAHAPYSNFHVGAAILLDNGEIITGSNQENAAFSSGTCAERSACFYAGSQYPGVPMRKIAIAAWTRAHHSADTPFDRCFQTLPISPCGACRQALLEYEAAYGPIQLILYGEKEIYLLPSVKSLMPLSFTEF